MDVGLMEEISII